MSADVTKVAEWVRAEVEADAGAGRFDLDRIGTFADLHDYVDANEYLLGAGERFGFDALREVDFCNDVTDSVAQWLEGRRER